MISKTLPFTMAQIERIIEKYPTPFHIYDERAIRENARALNSAFAWAPGFKEYFAVKATPNPYILKLFRQESTGVDCSSLPELLLAEACGFNGNEIFFTSNDTPAEEYLKARKLGAIINLDDISHIPFLEKCAGLPDTISLRYNPGRLRKGNAIIGDPAEAKYGFTRGQIFRGYAMLKKKGVGRFGLHAMIASNKLNARYFIETARMLFALAAQLKRRSGVTLDFINIGGGIGIPYRPELNPADIVTMSRGIRHEYERIIVRSGLHPVKLFMECGRYMTGPYGYLVARVRHLKNIYKRYAGLDACMADLMRPAIYGAYHHITVPGKKRAARKLSYDVTGSLCENNDKFAVDRKLPELRPGDIVVIHDTGAHGHAMGFNYNGKLRSAELLLRENGDVKQIRRAETADDYFATLDFKGLEKF
ncbi:MAG: diaminopimelate decarboxylase [Chitinispirillaceae bacterium]|nr:diaminopimelate decarboxylase [Chitinispirillaceae bacterium]